MKLKHKQFKQDFQLGSTIIGIFILFHTLFFHIVLIQSYDMFSDMYLKFNRIYQPDYAIIAAMSFTYTIMFMGFSSIFILYILERWFE